jgi:hypothetical protein
MSNLTLKPTDYKSLRDLNLRDYQNRSVGHNTAVQRVDESFVISYHFNPIARIDMWSVTVSNAGWQTPTTRNRLNLILRANGIPAGVFQKDYVQYLRFEGEVIPFDRTATFDMVAGTWTLAKEN